MDIQVFLDGLDVLFDQNRIDEIEPYCREQLTDAKVLADIGAQLHILNEMMGFFRETGQYDKSKACIQEALDLIDCSGLSDSLPHATTLLNAANALRAAGDLTTATDYYNRVFALFEGVVPQVDFRYAELYNNVALLYQELKRFDMASQCLLNALAIARQTPGMEFKVAVTLANLGTSELQENKQQEAKAHLTEAISLFQSLGAADNHYAAAIAGLAEVYYRQGDYPRAIAQYEKALGLIEESVGKSEAYERVAANLEVVREKAKQAPPRKTGLQLSREFYEAYGKPMIQEKFPEYANRIAVGFVGEGSDRFGFDDAYSEDHDFGEGFSLWLTKEDYEAVGADLQKAYEELLKDRNADSLWTVHAKHRLGVRSIRDFYQSVTGLPEGPQTREEWIQASEERLAAAVNGEVFRDDLGEFSRIRNQIKGYYSDEIWYLKLAQYTSLFGQYGQYNYKRMALRKDCNAAMLMRSKACEYAAQVIYLLNRVYRPHDKWLYRGLTGLKKGDEILLVFNKIASINVMDVEANVQQLEQIAAILLEGMIEIHAVYPRKRGDILYLENYGMELAEKADLTLCDIEELAEIIAKLEFQAFDQVKNEGGRAGCQDDWETFHIMRVSQYRTWTKEMLLQYIMDFKGTFADGWNMITEKYGRMMASTAPEEYAQLKPNLPECSEAKCNIVEEICKIQVEWMVAFKEQYPNMAGNARRIHTSEDLPWDTSYETYLRGELLTYSDAMLVLYGRFIAQLKTQEKNLAYLIMEQTAHLYGYSDLDAAEASYRSES